jgi:hypothetical protein
MVGYQLVYAAGCLLPIVKEYPCYDAVFVHPSSIDSVVNVSEFNN